MLVAVVDVMIRWKDKNMADIAK